MLVHTEPEMAKMSTKEPIFSERDRHNLESAITLGKVGRITNVLDKKHPVVDLCGILHYALSYNQTEIARQLITRYKCSVDCRNESKETPLHVACKKGNLNMVRMLMEHGADPKACNKDNDTPLHRAAIYGNTSVIICLIDDFKCSPDIKGSGGTTILHQACSAGHVELVEILLTRYNRTLDPMSVDDHGNTPLHHAALDGLVDVVKLLIKYKCSVDCKNNDKQTPLHYACCKGYLNIVRMLVSEYKADLYACSDDNSVPLIEAALVEAVLGGHTDIVQCLIEEFQCSPNVKVSNCRTLLHLACSAGHVELTEMLLTKKYNLNPLSGDSNGSTPLHLAALNGMVEIVKLLIAKHKCPVNCKDNNDKTPLHYACSGGHLNIVKTLVSEHKADLLARGRDGSGPLNEAAQGGHTNLIKYLIDKFHCSPKIRGPEDRTLLHQACSAGHVELTKTLLTSYKLNPLFGDINGSTPLHLAALSGMVEIVELLITKYKCPVNCKDNNDKTPLHYACSGGHLHVIRMLKTHNADINAPDVHNNTPLHLAAIHGLVEVVKCLLKEFNLTSTIVGHEGSNILHQACKYGHVELAEMLITCYNLYPLSVDDNGNTPLHYAALSGMEGVANLLITKFNCPTDRKNNKNKSPFDIALANDHQSIIKLMEGIKILEDQSADKDSHLLPMIAREGYVCAAQSKICIVQLPSDGITAEVQINGVDDPTLHPKLKATEFLLTPVVSISSDTKLLSSDKQAVIELLKTVEQNGNGNKPIPIFSNTHPLLPPKWQDFDPDDLKVLHDRIVFNTRCFGLFTVITRFPTPTASIKVAPNKMDPVELTLLEVPNLKVVIPPSSIKSNSEMELKISANFDHPIFCDEAVDASACIILGPHGLQFKERIPIRIPIPDYAQITGVYSNAKLKFLHSNDPLDSESVNWSVIPEDEYQIIKEGDEYVGIVYSTHFSNRKAVWLNIPKKIIKAIQGPIHEFRKFLVKRFMKTFSGRCQVFMSSETVIGNHLNFSITALLHPLQKPHKMPTNYSYLLYDSEEVPLKVKGSNLKLAVEMADYCYGSKAKECKQVLLSGDFSARADFNITLDSGTTIANGATLGELSIEHGESIPHLMNLIKPKIVPMLQLEYAEATFCMEPEVKVYLPSLDSDAMLSTSDFKNVCTSLWPARYKWQAIGIAVGVDFSTIMVIKKDNDDTDERFLVMVDKWLRSNNPVPCWKNLTIALESINIKVLHRAATLDDVISSDNVLSSPESSIDARSEFADHPRVSLPSTIAPKILPKNKSLLAKKIITGAVRQLHTSLDQWESNAVIEIAKRIAEYTERMAVYVCDRQHMKVSKEEFVALAGSIVSESDELNAKGNEVAEACTEKTLKKALKQSLSKIEPITKQFNLLKKVTESSQEQQGEAILLANAENLLSAVKKVVKDIQVATIEIKDHSVRERLGLKWVKRDVRTVKQFGPVFIPQK